MASVTHISTIPAQLLIGSESITLKKATALLQHRLCTEQGCGTCTQCRLIKEGEHPSIMWVAPEKNYTREQLAPLFEQLAFALDQQEQFFFVIEKADALTAACANSLLKSLEEPPHGYQFILLAQRLNAVMPTIRSRCTVHTISSKAEYTTHPLFDFFTSSIFHDPATFTKAVDQSGITERETMELVDALLAHWIGIYRNALLANNTQHTSESMHAIDMLSEAHATPPMPGSSKLFWKNLFLAMKQ